MYKTSYNIKAFKLRYKNNGAQELYESTNETTKDEKQAYKRAWTLSAENKFVTIDEIKSAKQRIITIGKYER